MIRYYHLIARNVKTGATTRMTRYAMIHEECCTMKSKMTEHKARTIEFEDATDEIMQAREMKAHGYSWAYDENGAHYYQKGSYNTGFHLMRLLPTDLPNGNFEFMALHNLTNTNKMAKH